MQMEYIQRVYLPVCNNNKVYERKLLYIVKKSSTLAWFFTNPKMYN